MRVVWWFRIIIKNLLLGYFHTPPSKRHEALQVIGQVLSYSRDEMKEVRVLSTLFIFCLIYTHFMMKFLLNSCELQWFVSDNVKLHCSH